MSAGIGRLFLVIRKDDIYPRARNGGEWRWHLSVCFRSRLGILTAYSFSLTATPTGIRYWLISVCWG